MNQLKVLIAHNSYQWAGGEDFVVDQETRLLESHGHKVFHLRATNKSIEEMSKAQLLKSVFWNDQSYRQVQDIIHSQQIDLIHIHNYFPLLSPSVFRAAELAGAAVVHTAHNYRLLCLNGLLFRDGQNCQDCVTAGNFLPGVIHRCYRASLSASALAALSLGFHDQYGTIKNSLDRLIAVSDLAAEKLQSSGVDPQLVQVKSNFLFADPGEGHGQGNFALFAGRLSVEKGIDVIQRCWRSGLKVPLTIAGDGPLKSEVVSLATENNSVNFTGWLSEQELLATLRQATVLIFPSHWYEAGTPIVVIQALASGTPVLMSDICAGAEIITKNGAGCTFQNNNADDLANVLRKLFENKSTLTDMRQRARALYLSEFSSNSNYGKLMSIYQEAIETRRCKKQVNG